MSDPRKQEFIDDHADLFNGEELTDASDASSISSVGSGRVSREYGAFRGEVGLSERLTDIFVDEGDGDLLLQRSDRDDRVLQWLQALDMQVMGACRADERLKPLLKANVSSGVAEDRLLVQLSQHFEPSEVGMLARCFCIPLVSIRVGKIDKRETLLCPTTTRGNLSLTLLPTSDLRLSFIGDDGFTERLCTLGSRSQCSAVVIKEISTDTSGRSFLVKVPGGRIFYYWCSEKSKLLGIELISKMKDLIERKPSVAELTGISESRLGCFATQLRAYLVGSTVSKAHDGCGSLASSFCDPAPDTTDLQSFSASSSSTKLVRPRQGSLSPRSSSFKEGLARNSTSLRSAAREKFRRRGDGHSSVSENITIASTGTTDSSSCNQEESDEVLNIKSCPFTPNILESFGKLSIPSLSHGSQASSSMGPPLFSPYYCWCPPGSTALQHSGALSECSTSSIDSVSVPPLSSILPINGTPSLLKPASSLSPIDVPLLDFPAFLPDPLVCMPVASSQQIPTFTPLICDPIVHIPVIDVCSSGQGYLVSAGPAISTTIPPLHPKLVNPLLPETDSMVEKGARETLRLLISGSSQTNPPLIDVLPALTNVDDKQGILVAGSRGLYSGTRDVNALADGIAAIGLVAHSGGLSGGGYGSKFGGCDNRVNRLKQPFGCNNSDDPRLEGESSHFPNSGKEFDE